MRPPWSADVPGEPLDRGDGPGAGSEPPASPPAARQRVLFVAEAVTLAHVARPVVLARALDPARYDVVLAAAPRYQALWRDLPFPVRPIQSITSGQFLDALARGRPLYDETTLRRYVEEDLGLIGEVAPDLVVGDFRLSLSVSARRAGVPYLAITNAYWSPYARQRFPMPALPLVKWVGVPIARTLFGAVRPLAFALHTRPLNRVRRAYGLPSLGSDLRRAYTDADLTLYADVPALVPTFDLPASHHYLGPVIWSPAVEPPDWWEGVGSDRPLVYVTMGSSGAAGLLSLVLDALSDLPVVVVAATLGQALTRPVPTNALTADYLPGQAAAARARLVVCNGGSPTTHQALAAGVPVLGLASNMDQHLNMAAVQRLGAGELLRSDRGSAAAIRAAASRILGEPHYAAAAGRLAEAFSGYDAPARFKEIVADQSPRR
jgi:UDP:flavonoid glycosyltransferase YjiC (YdhE family)